VIVVSREFIVRFLMRRLCGLKEVKRDKIQKMPELLLVVFGLGSNEFLK